MSNKLPFFKMWVKDILGDNLVDAMNAEEFGAYVRLLLMAWQEDPAASLPPDEGLLARWARLDTARWSACRERILACFNQGRDGRLYQKRLREEYESVMDESSKRSQSGKKGAAKRWQKPPDPESANNGKANGTPIVGAIVLPMPGQCHRASGYSFDSGSFSSGFKEGGLGETVVEGSLTPRPAGEFIDSAEDLAQRFFTQQTRRPRDPEYDVASMFRDLLTRVSPRLVSVEIYRKNRHRNESVKEFCNRIDPPEWKAKGQDRQHDGIAQFEEFAKGNVNGNGKH